MAIRTVATVLREGHPVDVGNLRIHTGAGTTIMHLNDGVQDNLGDAQYFEIEMATDMEVAKYPRNILLPDQAIDTKIELKARQTRFPRTDVGIGEFGLLARKETDAVYVEATAFNPRLNVDLVAKSGGRFNIAARAAAISATHLVVQKAALELDVAPDEFEALEPRLRGGRPMLQIADTLINGSGLCRRLCERGPDGHPEIVRLIAEIVTDHEQWPLRDFLAEEHEAQCATSCKIARNFDPTPQFAQRIEFVTKDWSSCGRVSRPTVTPHKKSLPKHNQCDAFSTGWGHGWTRFHTPGCNPASEGRAAEMVKTEPVNLTRIMPT
jgi:hypothetical protein